MSVFTGQASMVVRKPSRVFQDEGVGGSSGDTHTPPTSDAVLAPGTGSASDQLTLHDGMTTCTPTT